MAVESRVRRRVQLYMPKEGGPMGVLLLAVASVLMIRGFGVVVREERVV